MRALFVLLLALSSFATAAPPSNPSWPTLAQMDLIDKPTARMHCEAQLGSVPTYNKPFGSLEIHIVQRHECVFTGGKYGAAYRRSHVYYTSTDTLSASASTSNNYVRWFQPTTSLTCGHRTPRWQAPVIPSATTPQFACYNGCSYMIMGQVGIVGFPDANGSPLYAHWGEWAPNGYECSWVDAHPVETLQMDEAEPVPEVPDDYTCYGQLTVEQWQACFPVQQLPIPC